MKKIILLNIFIVIFFFIILELSISFFFNITKQGISPKIIDKNLEEYSFNNPNINNEKIFGVEVYTDSKGFRISKRQFLIDQNLNDKKEIFFIGGSVTFGAGIKQEETFSGILSNTLPKFNIYNASVMGSNIENNYKILINKITKEKLEYAIINFSLDDTESKNINNFNKEKKSKTLLDKFKNNKIIFNINSFIRANSKIYVLIKNYLFDAEARYFHIAIKNYSNNENLKFLNDYLDKFSKLNNDLSKKIVFISIPYSEQLKHENCNQKLVQEKIIEDEFYKHNLKLYNLKDLFCKNKKKDLFLKFDPGHLNQNGHKLVSDFVLKEILN